MSCHVMYVHVTLARYESLRLFSNIRCHWMMMKIGIFLWIMGNPIKMKINKKH